MKSYHQDNFYIEKFIEIMESTSICKNFKSKNITFLIMSRNLDILLIILYYNIITNFS